MECEGQGSYQEKEKKCYLASRKSGNEENSAIYKKIQIKTNVAIREAKLKAFK